MTMTTTPPADSHRRAALASLGAGITGLLWPALLRA